MTDPDELRRRAAYLEREAAATDDPVLAAGLLKRRARLLQATSDRPAGAAVDPAQVRSAMRHARSLLASATAMVTAGDLAKTRAALEAAQHACFDAKAICDQGGEYDHAANTPDFLLARRETA